MKRIAVPFVLLVSLVARSPVAVAADDDDDASLYKCKKLAANATVSVSLREDSSLRDLAVWVAGFTCKNVVFGADVAKHATHITLITPAKMTAKQAEQLFVDAVEAQGLMVTAKGETLLVKLGPKMPRGCPDPGGTAQGDPHGDAAAAEPVVADDPDVELLADVARGVRKIDDTHYEIDRKAADQVLASKLLARGARVVPSIKDGVANGFKLYAIRPGSVYALLGFQNGDTVREVNGVAIGTPSQALEVYEKQKAKTAFKLAITRRAVELELVITIR